MEDADSEAEATEAEFDDARWLEGEPPFVRQPRLGLVDLRYTADNHVGIYAGAADGAGLRLVGGQDDGRWDTVESLQVELAADEHLFAVAWEPPGGPGQEQMFIAHVRLGDGIASHTNTGRWRAALGPAGAASGLAGGEPPPADALSDALADADWIRPGISASSARPPWGEALAEVFDAGERYVWLDTFDPVSVTNTEETWVVFRTVAPVLPSAGRTALPEGGPVARFRGTFEVQDPGAVEARLDVLVDDGALVWLNGTRIHELNMTTDPDGRATPTTAIPRAGWIGHLELPAELLRAGRNLLAVEVHDADDGVGDLRFDALLHLYPRGEAPTPDAGLAPDVAPPPPPCGCIVADARVCGARLRALAAEYDCAPPALADDDGALLTCADGEWQAAEACAHGCGFTPDAPVFDDHCELPVCECFVRVAWCGRGAAREAEAMGCRIPLLPEHDGDILYCPDGQWAVREQCALGCVEAPRGTPDSCRDESVYRAPFDCGATFTCSNGNHTNTHTGNDAFAYDFAMPRGTTVRAMRRGRVHRVRNVSRPGDYCYDSGDRRCANSANTVEIRHSDGTIGLYMHLREGTVAAGADVAQGQVIGVSGNSGWSTGPHTHVQVQQNCGSWWCQSIPFTFIEDGNLRAGENVRSQNCQ